MSASITTAIRPNIIDLPAQLWKLTWAINDIKTAVLFLTED